MVNAINNNNSLVPIRKRHHDIERRQRHHEVEKPVTVRDTLRLVVPHLRLARLLIGCKVSECRLC